MLLQRYSHSERRPLPGCNSSPEARKGFSVEKRRFMSPVIPDNQVRLREVVSITILAAKALILHFVE